jgi:hypothetical protein
MSFYLTYNEQGSFISSLIQDVPPNETYIEVDYEIQQNWLSYQMTPDLQSIMLKPRVDQLPSIKLSKIAQIKSERDRRKLNGVFVSGKWFHTDLFSRTQWIAMTSMGASLPAITWTTMDYSTIILTPAIAKAVFMATANLDTVLFNHARDLALDVDACNTIEEVKAIAITGFTPTFGEQE